MDVSRTVVRDMIVREIIREIARHVGTFVFERAARVCNTKHQSSAPKRVGERMDVRKMVSRRVIVRERLQDILGVLH